MCKPVLLQAVSHKACDGSDLHDKRRVLARILKLHGPIDAVFGLSIYPSMGQHYASHAVRAVQEVKPCFWAGGLPEVWAKALLAQSLSLMHALQGQAPPADQPRMQRTTSTPAQPQVLSSWRPEMPEESGRGSPASPSPPGYDRQMQQPQGLNEEPLPCSSPPVLGMPARQTHYRNTGTEPVSVSQSMHSMASLYAVTITHAPSKHEIFAIVLQPLLHICVQCFVSQVQSLPS